MDEQATGDGVSGEHAPAALTMPAVSPWRTGLRAARCTQSQPAGPLHQWTDDQPSPGGSLPSTAAYPTDTWNGQGEPPRCVPRPS